MSENKKTEEKEVVKDDKTKDTENSEEIVLKTVEEQLKNEKKIEAGKTYTAEQVEAIAQESAKKGYVTSKNQLQSEIKSAKDKVAALEAEKQKIATELADAKTKVTEDKNPKSEEELATANAQITDLSRRLKAMEDEAVSATMKVNELSTTIENDKLKNYRQKLIDETGGQIVVGLVQGKTEAEILQSVEIAKAEYKRIADEERKTLKLPSREAEDNKKKDEQKEIIIPSATVKNAQALSADYQKTAEEIKLAIYRKNGFQL